MIEPDAYLLWGVTQNKDENGDIYEARECVLSFEPDDAGNIDMRISEADPLFGVDNILPLISTVTENAVNYTNNTIRAEAQGSIEEQEKALEHLRNDEPEKARDVLLDNIKYMNEREQMWKIHMEEVGDEAANQLKDVEADNQ